MGDEAVVGTNGIEFEMYGFYVKLKNRVVSFLLN
jgi:hypothetical protein